MTAQALNTRAGSDGDLLGGDLLRVVVCGSVDDGKSTLIGRLLHDCGGLTADQLEAVRRDSAAAGHAGEQIDLALLTDGLEAEREQGITIDVAYRHLRTRRRGLVIADVPGHEQYTRNMVSGASDAELAVLVLDVVRGVTAQTRRHAGIAALLGIASTVIAVNKMDLVCWDRGRFEVIAGQVCELAARLGLDEPAVIPMSALYGEGVVDRGDNLDWYTGPSLLEHLEQVTPRSAAAGWSSSSAALSRRLRFPVQLVIRPGHHFRGYAGTICEGALRVGDEVLVEPVGRVTAIERIVTLDGDLDEAVSGQSVTVKVRDDIDIARGDVIVDPEHRMLRARDLSAAVVWMSDSELASGRECLLQQAGRRLRCRIAEVTGSLDLETLKFRPASTLKLNDISRVRIALESEFVHDPYEENRTTGSFILIDPNDNSTTAAGMITAEARTAWDIVPEATLERQPSAVSARERAARFGQQPVTVLFTGLTCAGKSTLATALERALFDRGKATVRLDGVNIRLGVSRDLGFTADDRSENVRRTAEFARLVNDQGLIAIAALLAPDAEVRERARRLIGADRFAEIFLDPPVEVCRSRDAAGLYEAADRGEISSFPGVSAPYDKPQDADLVLDTSRLSVRSCTDAVLSLLEARLFIPATGSGVSPGAASGRPA